VVLRIDKDKERLSLGYKQLTPDPWEQEIPSKHQVGNSTRGKITKITDFGLFVELEGGVEGLIHISETGLEATTRMDEKFKVGDEIEAKIIKVDRDERKIALSLREQRRDSERQQMHEFHASQDKVDQSLGRAVRKDRRNQNEEEEG
jgi:small subunit ribosomal protein S1